MKSLKRKRRRIVADAKKAIKGEAEPLCICPCGKPVHVTAEHDGLIHELPMCELFESLPIDMYLTHVRRGMGIPDPPEDPGAS